MITPRHSSARQVKSTGYVSKWARCSVQTCTGELVMWAMWQEMSGGIEDGYYSEGLKDRDTFVNNITSMHGSKKL